MEINRIIKMKREEKGYTMKELSEKIGVSESAISRWESGEIDNMRRKNIVALSKILDIKPSAIMGWEEPKEAKQETLENKLLCKFNQLSKENKQKIISNIDFLLFEQSKEKETALIG